MEKQQFLDKFEELKSPANAERWAVLQLWLVEAKSDGEIAKALDKDRSTATRKIGEICKHFGAEAKVKKEQRQHLVLLFRRYCKDFEVHPSVYPDWVDGDLSDRPQPPTNPPNIPTPESIPELTTLEFIGRDRDLTNLANLSRQAKIVLIKAGAGVGKSTLAREFLQTQFKKVIRIEMGLESGNVTPAEEKVSQILRKDFDEEPSRDFGINLDILREKLADRANPIGVLIDNLEPALDETYRFREKLRGYDALLAVLGDRDVFSFTLITSRRSLIATRARVHEYSLEGLDITAWRQYFHDCENGADSEALMQMRDAYNGNAKVMDILHGAIKNRFDGNIRAYWNRYKDALLADSELETLISVEMDWLQDNQPDAYKLLCRMGCYRYQDVKTVPFEGLICLLWDVSESRQISVVDYLSKTSLIEFKKEYYLHPAVRDFTKSCLLKDGANWEMANRKVAIFWMKSIETIESFDDAIEASEAYNHLYIIQDYQLAGEVICQSRRNKWVPQESLGGALYRLGLLEKLLTMVFNVIDKIQDNFLLANLYTLLGDIQWVKGSINTAIYYHKKCYNCSQYIIDYTLKKDKKLRANTLSINSLFNIVLCQIDLWEIEKAKKGLEFVIEIIRKRLDQNKKDNMDDDTCFFVKRLESLLSSFNSAFLAYIYSCLGEHRQALFLIEMDNLPMSFTKSSSGWGKAHHLIFCAKTYTQLNNFKDASMFFSKALDYSQDSNYIQVKAKAILGLAEIYRCQNNFGKSIINNLEAIKLFQIIKVKPDLAEAYFQLGLTYQAMGEHDQAEEYKAKAIELFAQMEAPKQIERVKKAFEGNIQ